MHNVYLGSVAANLVTLGQRELGRSPTEWALYGSGFVVSIVAVVYLNRIAQRALDGYAQAEPDQGEAT